MASLRVRVATLIDLIVWVRVATLIDLDTFRVRVDTLIGFHVFWGQGHDPNALLGHFDQGRDPDGILVNF